MHQGLKLAAGRNLANQNAVFGDRIEAATLAGISADVRKPMGDLA